jgi:hypothetical protein
MNSILKNDFHKRVGISYWQRLGRFNTFRQTYSFLQNKIQSLNTNNYINRLEISEKTIFTDIQVNKIVTDIEKSAIAFGLQLPPQLVAEIYNFATHTPCTEPRFDSEFVVSDINSRIFQDGSYVMRGLVNNLTECAAIQQIVHDPLLLNVVREYLKYWPTLITQHLTWSFASSLSETEIKKIYPPTNFHYDVAGCNFMTAYFYITDVDINSGPHIMIQNSLKHKPLKMLLASNRQSDEDVYNYYGKESELVITGKSGFGFMQDPSCIHKVQAPRATNRLLLQIRYS